MSRRLVVDVMNVIGSRPTGWWNDPDKAMREMAETLDLFAARAGEHVTAVFDKDPGGLGPFDNLEVVIATRKGRNAADHSIELLVSDDSDPASLTVITSDRRLVENVQALGAKVIGSGGFRSRLDRVTAE
jgi:predicted RNA-binding protein with PIN domain